MDKPLDHTQVTPSPSPWLLGRYELRGELGKGGMGIVYEAWDPSLERTVAIKLIRFGPDTGKENFARFKQEALMVARLNHPGIVDVLDVFDVDGAPAIVMNLVKGRSLQQCIETGISTRQALKLLHQVALAVQHAHDHGVIHRDLKPANILLAEPDDRPVILDFGLAKDLEKSQYLTATGQVMGTPTHMAPEQMEAKVSEVGGHTDIWALGVILYRALTGEAPFEASSHAMLFKQILLDPPTPPRRLNSEISADLEQVIMQCLEKEPRNRYRSARELARDLNQVLRGKPLGFKHRSSRPTSTGRLVGVTLATVVVVTVAALVLTQSKQPSPRQTPPKAVPGPAVAVARKPELLAFAGLPDEIWPSAALRTLEVLVQDANGKLVSEGRWEIQLALTRGDGEASLSGGTAARSQYGVARFKGLRIDGTGSGHQLLAFAPDLRTATSPAFDLVKPSRDSPDNLARNPARTELPSPLESDPGWSHGHDPWGILDGIRYVPGEPGDRQNLHFRRGLALRRLVESETGQITIDLGEERTFDRVMIWHHSRKRVPARYDLEIWQGEAWQEIPLDPEAGKGLVFPHFKKNQDEEKWWMSASTPTLHQFKPVTARKLRYVVWTESLPIIVGEHPDGRHAWVYEIEIYAPKPAREDR